MAQLLILILKMDKQKRWRELKVHHNKKVYSIDDALSELRWIKLFHRPFPG